MSNDNDQIMTLNEVADYLRLAERTVLRMVHQGKIPCVKIASQWRFIRSFIDDWIISKMNIKTLQTPGSSEGGIIPISRIINEKYFINNIRPGNKKEILEQLIDPLISNNIIKDPDTFLFDLMEREKIVSTGLGRGIAIPHIRNIKNNPSDYPILVLGICSEGTNFNSLDGKLTYLFFLLCTNNDVVHLKTMGKINRLFMDEKLIKEIIASGSFTEVSESLLKKEYELIYTKKN